MATFKAVVRRKRADNFYPVYIRVTHNRKSAYIKTDKVVTKKELTKNNEIKDAYVLQFCTQRILEYNNELNKRTIQYWTVKEVVEYLQNGNSDICFSDYARVYINKLISNNQERTAKNYKLALNHLERFAGTNKLMFSHFTSHLIGRWIKILEETTKRAKEMYPVCMRQIFRVAMLEYNDYDNGIIKIKTNPWIKVKIPSSDDSQKIAITAEECRDFFSFPIPESKMKLSQVEFGRDIAMMVLCLAGINTVDLYNLRKKNYANGIIKYERAKTRKFRSDKAYMEMRVPPILKTVFEKYLDRTEDDHLFVFHKSLSSSDSFGASVNRGIYQICEAMGKSKDDWYSVYTFRHTWATIAQNDIKASITEVGFGLNHSSMVGNRVTRSYVKIDFTSAWELNEKVIDFIFFSGKTSSRHKQEMMKDEENTYFRLSNKYLIKAEAYHNGTNVAEFTDTGYSNIDEVIRKISTILPDYIPDRSMIIIKLTNIDKQQTAVYQRQKGKGI